MKKHRKLVLKQVPLIHFKDRIWQKGSSKSEPDPITTSGMICTLIGRK
ncbi:hypothetical protein [Dyadobacter sp. CY312]|nr:hypothetical protein [Dyadobacter sp. CY312]MCE7044208.1 hypothetical protein [Dyadobacter sp. CY312]